ncbi:MAG: hypothetical protein WAN43_17950 [Rhodomicrobium sp.]
MDVTKLDAAKSQIATAIRLYFEDCDPISVHTLVHAGCEILDRLCEAKGTPGMRTDMMKRIKPEHRKTVSDKLNVAANFFKHAATSKPDLVLRDFDDESNLMGLIHATEGLRLLGVDLPHEMVFRACISIAQPDLLLKPLNREELVEIFGEAWGQSRAEQKKAGHNALSSALSGN